MAFSIRGNCKLDNVLKILDVMWSTSIIWIPVLFWFIARNPKVDLYFHKGLIIAENVDDALEQALVEFPNNPILNTIDDIVDRVIEILHKAGYRVKTSDLPKVETKVIAQINRKEGMSIDWESGKVELNYNKKF